MTAEELKEAVRQYANEHFPGWRTAGVLVRMGEFGEGDSEMLLVLPANDEPQPQRVIVEGK